jgi:hypothetical protein
MSFELLHFRDADKILKKKKLTQSVISTMQYLSDALHGTLFRGELLRQALTEMDWRHEPLNILDGRRYQYKGLRQGVAIDGSFSSYEYIQDALLRLQVGFDKQRVEVGIVLLTSQRSEKSPLGSTRELVEQEIKDLFPTISLPVCIALFDLGGPGIYTDEAEGETSVDQTAGNNPEVAGDSQVDNVPIPDRLPKVKKKRPRVTLRKEGGETCPA